MRRVATPLLAATLCAAVALVTYVAAFHVARLQWADAQTLHVLTQLQGTRLAQLADWFSALASPLPYALLTAALIVTAVRTRGPLTAAIALAIIVGANTVTQQLKPALAVARPYLETGDWVSPASWPSGHATASMVLALAAILVAPPARRAAVAVVGFTYTAVVASSVVLLGWHFPSDAIGGFAVAGCAAGLGAAVLAAFELAAATSATRRGPRAAPRRPAPRARG